MGEKTYFDFSKAKQLLEDGKRVNCDDIENIGEGDYYGIDEDGFMSYFFQKNNVCWAKDATFSWEALNSKKWFEVI